MASMSHRNSEDKTSFENKNSCGFSKLEGMRLTNNKGLFGYISTKHYRLKLVLVDPNRPANTCYLLAGGLLTISSISRFVVANRC